MAKTKRAKLELTRLKRIMDVVFALVIWRLFILLPRPAGDVQWDSIASMIGDKWGSFLFVALALIIVIIYWVQNNELFSRLHATDSIHTGISIFQIFFLLLFLYSIGLGLHFDGGPDARVMESVMVFMVGLCAYLGWKYAMRNGLVSEETTAETSREVLTRNFAEPATALITIPFAFVGPWFWELSWFLYPGIKYMFSRR